ncbi:MAG: DUF429 domain-containing protein [Desulfobacterales bacterium]|nr:DUF429 domain-containing protein [Desulfobacterales bacterium]
MDSRFRYIGVDGCRSGWFYVGLDSNLSGASGILPAIREIDDVADENTIVMIDIPIGLKEKDTQERACDTEARKLLKKRSSSIFPAPSRMALAADDYPAASRINAECTGRKLSMQTYHILHKIREVDDFIFSGAKKIGLREFHPELGFLALNNFNPLAYSKKHKKGRLERLKILETYFRQAPEILQKALDRFLRKQVAADDILDAAAGAVTALLRDRLVSLPHTPEYDSRGLKMEIVYPAVEP